jgi:16S rRNA G966 N2-methylase RsmD
VVEGYAIIRASVERALKSLRAGDFEVLFLDPPYDADADRLREVLALAGDRLTDAGVLVLEHARRRAAPDAAGRLVRTRQIASGDSALTLYAPARERHA